MIEKNKRIIILDNIRSILNVGSIFRTADAIGNCEIWLVGVTPAPIDRFGRERNDLKKTALGAEKNLIWRQISNENILEELEKISQDGFEIISVEQNKQAIDYKKVSPKEKCAIIFGSETDGVSLEILKNSGIIAELKMSGQKESLNVSVTAGIVLYRWFDK
jgi:23S rRNA (guanosine2251-2'-O)-methyltransferase